MKRGILFIVFLVSIWQCFGQQTDTIFIAYVSSRSEEIKFSSIKKFENPKPYDYQGSYHFGESESESQLEIIYSNDKFFARSEFMNWGNHSLEYEREYIEYANGKIYLGKTSYELFTCVKTVFMTLEKGTKGLVSYYDENMEDKIIHRYVQFNKDNGAIKNLVGKYPEASFIKLNIPDLILYSKHDLKIMRNEIFARNGYVFKEGGEMDTYFLQKKWYASMPKTNNVNLNDIEKHNVDLIFKLEKEY